jgi:hypothetical protein
VEPGLNWTVVTRYGKRVSWRLVLVSNDRLARRT